MSLYYYKVKEALEKSRSNPEEKDTWIFNEQPCHKYGESKNKCKHVEKLKTCEWELYLERSNTWDGKKYIIKDNSDSNSDQESKSESESESESETKSESGLGFDAILIKSNGGEKEYFACEIKSDIEEASSQFSNFNLTDNQKKSWEDYKLQCEQKVLGDSHEDLYKKIKLKKIIFEDILPNDTWKEELKTKMLSELSVEKNLWEDHIEALINKDKLNWEFITDLPKSKNVEVGKDFEERNLYDLENWFRSTIDKHSFLDNKKDEKKWDRAKKEKEITKKTTLENINEILTAKKTKGKKSDSTNSVQKQNKNEDTTEKTTEESTELKSSSEKKTEDKEKKKKVINKKDAIKGLKRYRSVCLKNIFSDDEKRKKAEYILKKGCEDYVRKKLSDKRCLKKYSSFKSAVKNDTESDLDNLIENSKLLTEEEKKDINEKIEIKKIEYLTENVLLNDIRNLKEKLELELELELDDNEKIELEKLKKNIKNPEEIDIEIKTNIERIKEKVKLNNLRPKWSKKKNPQGIVINQLEMYFSRQNNIKTHIRLVGNKDGEKVADDEKTIKHTDLKRCLIFPSEDQNAVKDAFKTLGVTTFLFSIKIPLANNNDKTHYVNIWAFERPENANENDYWF